MVPRAAEAAGRTETREAAGCGNPEVPGHLSLLAKQGEPLGPLPWVRRGGEGQSGAKGRTAPLSVAQEGGRQRHG